MKLNPKIIELITHHILADEQFAFSFFQQVSSLDTNEGLSEYVRENLERNAVFFASPTQGGYEFADYSSEDEIPEGTVFVMRLSGPVMLRGSYGIPGMSQLLAQLQWAADQKNIAGTVFSLETGGGSSYGLWKFCDAVAELRDKKPIVMYANGFCASAGMAIAAHGSEIFADHSSSQVGSIGACMSYLDMMPWFEKAGCKYHYVNAPTNPDKNKSAIEMRAGKYDTIKEELTKLHAGFKDRMRANREGISDSAMTGKMYTATEAIDLKIIDGIASLEQAVSRVIELSNNLKM